MDWYHKNTSVYDATERTTDLQSKYFKHHLRLVHQLVTIKQQTQ